MQDELAQVFVQVYSKLAATFSAKGVVGSDGDAILSLMVPGLYIDPHLDPDDPETQYYVANALSPVLGCSWRIDQRAGTVTDVYKSILDGKETPLVSLPPEKKALVNQALALLFTSDGVPSPTYDEYRAFQSRYLSALDALDQAKETHSNGGPPVPPELEEAVYVAERAWRKRGFRNAVDDAISVLSEYEAYEPAAYWRRLAEQYATWTRTAGADNQFQLLTCVPPYETWFEEFGWIEYRFEEKDFLNQERSGGAGAGDHQCCVCDDDGHQDGALAFSSSRRGDFRRDRRAIGAEISNLVLSCRLRRVEIIRPWLDPNVFASRAWRWSPASVTYGTVISSGGDIAGSSIPTGRMPILPTTAILARDVVIDWKDGAGLRALSERRAVGEELAFGPFRLTRAVIDPGGHIYLPDPQLIGFRSVLLPRCPNPDAALPWPKWSISPAEFPRAAAVESRTEERTMSDIERKRAEDPKEIVGYWTPERRKNARPAVLRRREVRGSSDQSPRPAGERSGWDPRRAPGKVEHFVPPEPVPHPREYPWRTIGKLFYEQNGEDCVASAFVIAGTGIVTAAHVLFDFDTQSWSRRILFVPAYENGEDPFGSWPWSHAWVFEGWARDGEAKYDLGLLKLERRDRDGRGVGEVVGTLGITVDREVDRDWTDAGYPAPHQHGELMYRMQGHFTRTVEGGAIVGMQGILGPGTSGGPWLLAGDQRYANGLDSFETEEYPGESFSPYFRRATLDFIRRHFPDELAQGEAAYQMT